MSTLEQRIVEILDGYFRRTLEVRLDEDIPAAAADIAALVTAAPSGVYVVMFSNYEPAEVRAIYDNHVAAEAHADALGEGWRTLYWPADSRYRPDDSDHLHQETP